MDLAHLTGQRPADLLKLNRGDIRDGLLFFTQNKTGNKLRIEITGELNTLIKRILSREHKTMGVWLATGWQRSTALIRCAAYSF
jgi:integrase